MIRAGITTTQPSGTRGVPQHGHTATFIGWRYFRTISAAKSPSVKTGLIRTVVVVEKFGRRREAVSEMRSSDYPTTLQ